ncbi:hypothetical protein [Brevibacillus reuszeri]|uniref:hypothetical protein n=1 Tax=Brevibacillus reuszeri TaxID=54915 RepID=UPI00289D6149|nr:hypothetical protein [Brevibacillus reuszeri]
MYIKVTGDSEDQKVLVLGEPLIRQKQDDYYLLPGRLVRALKPDDLPIGIRFKLAGALPSGYGFYREDTVIFRRLNESSALWIDVTSAYLVSEWDGLFPLEATVLARKTTLEQLERFCSVRCETGEQLMKIRYEFSWCTQEELDLERALEQICDTVFEVEAKGNARLWPGHGHF